MKRALVMLMITGLLAASAAFAAVPEKISYQGVLTTSGGGIVPNGNYNLTLSLYDALSGGTALWTEGQLVSVTNGIFNVILGSVTPIQLAFDTPLYLGVAVAGGTELTPRTMLTASPYSLNAPVMAFVSSGSTTPIGATWTNYENEQVTLYCPASGYVVVTSTAWLLLNHVSGTEDRVEVAHDTIPTGPGPSTAFRATYQVPASAPTAGNLDITLPVQTVFAIEIPGTYTFYLNGEMFNGQDVSDVFWYAGTTATWYPASSAPARAAAVAPGLNAREKARPGETR